MKKIVFLMCLALISNALFSNNIQVSNISLTGQNTTNKTVQVQFTVSWENSWRVSTGPGNWDAAWVFVKFRKGSNGVWNPSSLLNTGQVAPAGSVVSVQAWNPFFGFGLGNNYGVGAFVHRSANGSGTFTVSNAQLRWFYGQDGLTDVDQVDIQVFALEMVYVPQGDFAAGDGATGAIQFTLTTINTATANTAPSGSGSLGGSAGGYPTGQIAPVSADWPNGFRAFYCMKYEVSQQGYVDFLNTLTRLQQANRVGSNIASGISAITNRFVLTNNTIVASRNGVACNSDVNPVAPIRFYCDLNANLVGGEAADGKELACSALSVFDLAAYLAWAGLRPITELEFEKCGRGNQPAIPNEYPWGSRFSSSAKVILDLGLPTERGNPDANANVGAFQSGPMRNGAFATAGSGREQAGAGYYGAMELGGNLWERCISLATLTGRNYAGGHGNGKLDVNGGTSLFPDWPGSADGYILRGSAYTFTIAEMELSNRSAGSANTLRNGPLGGRGGRSIQ
jgi:formylglycine-generating enzyme required for sulfatase activity